MQPPVLGILTFLLPAGGLRRGGGLMVAALRKKRGCPGVTRGSKHAPRGTGSVLPGPPTNLGGPPHSRHSITAVPSSPFWLETRGKRESPRLVPHLAHRRSGAAAAPGERGPERRGPFEGARLSDGREQPMRRGGGAERGPAPRMCQPPPRRISTPHRAGTGGSGRSWPLLPPQLPPSKGVG